MVDLTTDAKKAEALRAVSALVGQVNGQGHPHTAHSVFLQTFVGEDGQFAHRIVMALAPGYRPRNGLAPLTIPPDFQGVPVVRGEWGKAYTG